MPELPDVTVYVECLERRIADTEFIAARVASPFLVRTFDPPLFATHGKRVVGVTRLGKRIVITLEGELHLVFHLMIAGRFRWRDAGARVPGKIGLAAFDFPSGSLIMTEASAKKRASLHVVQGAAALAEHDPGGLEIADATLDEFTTRLRARNHTLKRALTSPRIFSGVGNAYSDEILWDAQLSPLTWTSRLGDDEIERLYASTLATLDRWTRQLRNEVGTGFPEKVTAFLPGMAVHGKFREACPRCGDPVQRIQYASRETNYCATCQTNGKVLADRVLSQLLKKDWPRTLEEWELIRQPNSEKPS
ncbi:MAG: formamidopyrimidine-DNA glycosylase [Acidobacteria bacterium]|nr:formamidopyrimidine-DNA glycosylase [Acidobacteriota bacterium]